MEGGYPLELFVKEEIAVINRFDLKCAICLDVFDNVVETTTCGHLFCEHCIKRSLDYSRQCPLCKRGLTLSKLRKSVKMSRIVMDLKVQCLNKANGVRCSWTGTLQQLSGHKPLCSFNRVKCSNCSLTMFRFEMEEHLKTNCMSRKVRCAFCHLLFLFKNLQAHQKNLCSFSPVECPNSCGAAGLTRSCLSDHIEHRCPRRCIECPFACYGCIARLTSTEMKLHMQNKSDAHFKLIEEDANKNLSHCKTAWKKMVMDTKTVETTEQEAELREEKKSVHTEMDEMWQKLEHVRQESREIFQDAYSSGRRSACDRSTLNACNASTTAGSASSESAFSSSFPSSSVSSSNAATTSSSYCLSPSFSSSSSNSSRTHDKPSLTTASSLSSSSFSSPPQSLHTPSSSMEGAHDHDEPRRKRRKSILLPSSAPRNGILSGRNSSSASLDPYDFL
eukprot:TRINITY_DN4616_c0_g1_i1.p1 TRINITY_DN4616_c0_g1~~TRINITY_DN4616_c0_g1_i1.p1  ORF type:complete len:447 (+),score=70.61 TRINITY_DN4616_c0_g1_i1:22-1362(+)